MTEAHRIATIRRIKAVAAEVRRTERYLERREEEGYTTLPQPDVSYTVADGSELPCSPP